MIQLGPMELDSGPRIPHLACGEWWWVIHYTLFKISSRLWCCLYGDSHFSFSLSERFSLQFSLRFQKLFLLWCFQKTATVLLSLSLHQSSVGPRFRARLCIGSDSISPRESQLLFVKMYYLHLACASCLA